MKPIYVLALAASLCACLCARTFTSTDGATVEGEYENVISDFVLIKTAEGRQLKLPLENLIETDREYCFECAVREAAARDGVLRFASQPVRTVFARPEYSELLRNSHKITLQNRMPFTLREISVRYALCLQLFTKSVVIETKTVPRIDAYKDYTFETEGIESQVSRMPRSRAPKTKAEVWVRAYWRDIMVGEYKSDARFFEGDRWSNYFDTQA